MRGDVLRDSTPGTIPSSICGSARVRGPAMETATEVPES